MAEEITIERLIFGKNTFVNVVDTEFRQLIPEEPKTLDAPPTTVDKFFDDYDTLFYDIPPTGSINSHQEIVNRSSEYLGISVEELESEIRILREENVSLKNQLFVLTNPTN
jgi:hypothetical protein